MAGGEIIFKLSPAPPREDFEKEAVDLPDDWGWCVDHALTEKTMVSAEVR